MENGQLRPPLTDEELVEKGYELSELWFINYTGHIQGPYHLSQIEEMLVENPQLLNELSLCPFENEDDWKPLSEMGLFEIEAPEIAPELPSAFPSNLPKPLSKEILKKSRALAMGQLHQAEEEEIVAQETLSQIVRPQDNKNLATSVETPLIELPTELHPEKKISIPFNFKWIGVTAAVLLLVVSSFMLWPKNNKYEEHEGDSFASHDERSQTSDRSPSSINEATPIKSAEDYRSRKMIVEQKNKNEFDQNQRERLERLRRYRHPKAMVEYHLDPGLADREVADREHEAQRQAADNAHDPAQQPVATYDEPVQDERDRAPANEPARD